MTFWTCCEAADKVAPRGTTYMRRNIYGGHDYYNRQGKIGSNRKTYSGDKYYSRRGLDYESYGNRIYYNRNYNWSIE